MTSNIILPIKKTELHVCRLHLKELFTEVASVLILSWHFTVQGLRSLWRLVIRFLPL